MSMPMNTARVEQTVEAPHSRGALSTGWAPHYFIDISRIEQF